MGAIGHTQSHGVRVLAAAAALLLLLLLLLFVCGVGMNADKQEENNIWAVNQVF